MRFEFGPLKLLLVPAALFGASLRMLLHGQVPPDAAPPSERTDREGTAATEGPGSTSAHACAPARGADVEEASRKVLLSALVQGLRGLQAERHSARAGTPGAAVTGDPKASGGTPATGEATGEGEGGAGKEEGLAWVRWELGACWVQHLKAQEEERQKKIKEGQEEEKAKDREAKKGSARASKTGVPAAAEEGASPEAGGAAKGAAQKPTSGAPGQQRDASGRPHDLSEVLSEAQIQKLKDAGVHLHEKVRPTTRLDSVSGHWSHATVLALLQGLARWPPSSPCKLYMQCASELPSCQRLVRGTDVPGGF